MKLPSWHIKIVYRTYSINLFFNGFYFKNASEIVSFNVIPADTSLEITELDVSYGNNITIDVKVISDIAINEGVVSISIYSVNTLIILEIELWLLKFQIYK